MPKLSQEEKERKRREYDKQRDEFEPSIMGGYRQIYPCQEQVRTLRYEKQIDTSQQIYDYFNNPTKKKDPSNLKAAREDENGRSKPPWKNTGIS